MSTTAIITCPVLPVDRSAALVTFTRGVTARHHRAELKLSRFQCPMAWPPPFGEVMTSDLSRAEFIVNKSSRQLDLLIGFGPRAVAGREDNKVR